MINANDIKNGMTLEIEGKLYVVLEFLHVKPGKGPAFLRTKLKNLRSGTTLERTFNTNIKFKKAHIDKNKMQFLYAAGDKYTFMNMETYDQIEIEKDQIQDEIKFLKENLETDLVFYEGELIGINLPDKIDFKVTFAPDAVKGNTTSGAQKEIEIETGHTLLAPLFIKEGETIVVSTKDGKYDSRK